MIHLILTDNDDKSSSNSSNASGGSNNSSSIISGDSINVNSSETQSNDKNKTVRGDVWGLTTMKGENNYFHFYYYYYHYYHYYYL